MKKKHAEGLRGRAAEQVRWGMPFRRGRQATSGIAPQPAGGSRPETEEDAAVREPELARLEAALFLAKAPLSGGKLSQLADLPPRTRTDVLVRRLNELYDRRGCAFRVVSVAKGYQLRTRPEFASWLRRLRRLPLEVRLSSPALETLAVVAYRQPILRTEIEAIRGVQCGEILRQLIERGLVKVVGRSDELGRPYLYGTTSYFLEVFGLRDLDELPFPEYRKPIEANVSTAASVEEAEENEDSGLGDPSASEGA
ncbi:hypothetical protein JCM19992_32450 [Thermostilla marina]